MEDMRADGPRTEHRRLDHDEVLAWIAENRAWRRCRKTGVMLARAARPDEVGSILIEHEGPAKVYEGAWLCFGPVGDCWLQTREKIDAKYVGGCTVTRTMQFDAHSGAKDYIEFTPRPGLHNWAAQVDVPGIDEISVRSGDPDRTFTARPGSYVLRGDCEDPYAAAADVWIVQRAIFEATYEFEE